ncbi:hypothetical protein HPHPP25D_1467 [Helicobacter pylori Hp P-25d]|nr:hypothetical protein HPHPP25D_1467 [Helicobacter pylori Hp P-25d]
MNEREIYDLDYAIVKAKDLKPSYHRRDAKTHRHERRADQKHCGGF